MKTYSNRSNAVRAAKSAFGANYEEAVKVMLAVDGKGFNLVPVKAVLVAPAALVATVVEAEPECPACQHNPKGACVVCAVEMDDDLVPQPAPVSGEHVTGFEEHGLTNCPRCEIHLSNGVNTIDSLVETHGDKAYDMLGHQFYCMACDFEWGSEVTRPTKTGPTGTGIKIQKDREERNGIKRPSTGGACAAVWDWCDAVVQHTNTPPTAKEVKAKAAEAGWNANNATIEYYGWRKWMGIVGRAKSPTAK